MNQGQGFTPTPTGLKKKKWPIYLLVGLLVFIVGGFGLYYFTKLSKSPSRVARGFVKSLSKNDLKSAYEMTSRQFQATVTVNDLEKFLIQYPILSDVSSMNFKFKDINNDIARVSGELKGKDGNNAPITFVIVKENDDWKVLNLSLNPNDVPRDIAAEKK